jgi:DNA mismatch repair protein MutS
LLLTLEEGQPPRTGAASRSKDQLDLFARPDGGSPEEREVLDTLRETDVDRLAPLDALTLVARLKRRITDG